MKESNDGSFEKSENYPLELGSLVEVDVPHDGSCLFYAVTLSVLLPLLDQPNRFESMYIRLFGEKNQAGITELWKLLNNYDGSIHFIKIHATSLEVLIDIEFRQRLVMFIKKHENEFRSFYSEEEPLERRLQVIRSPKTWGGQEEIEAISRFLEIRINLYEYRNQQLQSHNPHGEAYLTAITLVFTSAGKGSHNNHYHYLIAPRYILKMPILLEQKEESEESTNSDMEIDAIEVQTLTSEQEIFDCEKLITAIQQGDKETVEKIIQNLKVSNRIDSFINKEDDSGKTALHYAAEFGHLAIVKIILSSTKRIQYANEYWKIKPIHLAAEKGHDDVLKLFIEEKKVDVDHETYDTKNTPLHLSVKNNHVKCVDLLLKKGANPLKKNEAGETAFDLARSVAKNKDIKNLFGAIEPVSEILNEVARLPLLNKIRDLNHPKTWPHRGEKWKKFKEIIMEGFNHSNSFAVEIIKSQIQYLRLRKTSNNAPDQFLYFLCVDGVDDVIDFLITNGIDFTRSTYHERLYINIPKKYLGLYCAIAYKKLRVVKVLLQDDARILQYLHPDLMPDDQRTPLAYARELLQEEKDLDEKSKLETIIDYLQEKELRYTVLPRFKKRTASVMESDELEETPYPEFDPENDKRLSEEIFKASMKLVSGPLVSPSFHLISPSESHTDQPADYLSEAEYKRIDKRNRYKGIMGEAFVFFRLKDKYKHKYANVSFHENQPKEGFSLEGRYAATEQNQKKGKAGKLVIKVIWNNKLEWEEWQEARKIDKKLKFNDPGKFHYDLLIEKKKVEMNECTQRFVEVKTTESKTETLVSLSGPEYKMMMKNKDKYRLFHVSSLFQDAHIQKYKDVHKVLDAADRLIKLITFQK